MQKYYKMKRESPDLFQVSPTSEMHDLLSMQMQQMLPERDDSGRVIYVFRVRKWNEPLIYENVKWRRAFFRIN